MRRAPIQRALQKVSATLRRQPLPAPRQCLSEGWAYPRAPLNTLNPGHHPIPIGIVGTLIHVISMLVFARLWLECLMLVLTSPPLDVAVGRLAALFPTSPCILLPEIAGAVGSEEVSNTGVVWRLAFVILSGCSIGKIYLLVADQFIIFYEGTPSRLINLIANH